MSERRRLAFLILVMVMAAGMTGTVALAFIYQATVGQHKATLSGVVASQVEFIDRLNKLDRALYPLASREKIRQLVLEEVAKTYSTQPELGRTGEVLLGQLHGGKLEILVSSRLPVQEFPLYTTGDSKRAMPMRNALAGKTGTIFARDYRGAKVLAAYMPVNELGLGVVAKIDLAEIHRPFLQAIAVVSLMALLLVAALTFWFSRITDPLYRRLTESEQRYRTLAESTDAIPWELDLIADRFVYVAPQAERLLGYKPTAWLNLQWLLDRLHPDDQLWVQQFSEQQTAAGKSHNLEFRFIARDGHPLWMRAMIDVVKKENRPAALRGYMIDISARKQSEEELRTLNALISTTNQQLSALNEEITAANEELTITNRELSTANDGLAQSQQQLIEAKEYAETLIESANVLVVGLDSQGRIDLLNECAERTLGYRKQELLGRSWVESAIPPGERDAVRTVLTGLHHGGAPRRYVSSVMTKSGQPRRIEWQNSLLTHNGSRGGVISFGMDITEREQAALALEESEERYHSLFEDAAVPIWEEDFSLVKRRFDELYASGIEDISLHLMDDPAEVERCAALVRITNINRESMHFFGVGSVAELSTQLPSYFVDETWLVFQRELAALARGETRFESEISIRDHTGARKELLLKLSISPGSLATWSRVLVSYIDITERKRATEDLREANEQLQATLSALPDLLFELTPDGRIVSFHAPRPELLYLPPEQFTGKSIAEVLPEPAVGVIRAAMAEAIKHGRHTGAQYFLELPEGTSWFELSIATKGDIHAPEGRLIMLAHDITMRKQAQIALADAEEFSRKIIDVSSVGVMAYRSTGQIVLANQAAARIIGGRVEDLLKQNFRELQSWQDSGLISAADRVLESGAAESSIFHLRTTFGRDIWADAYLSAFIAQGQRNLLLILNDITDRISAENARNTLEEQLRQSHKMEAIGTLAGGIAHDFNNILFAILGNAELIDETLTPGSAAKSNMQSLLSGVNRARDLVKQILAFSRKTQPELVQVDLVKAVREVFQLIRASVPSTIEIILRLEPERAVILADTIEIHQMLMNLCTNSAQAMEHRQGQLEIRLREVRLGAEEAARQVGLEPRAYFELSVADTGGGMSPEVRERIFEPFFTTKEQGKGTGLGLSVVHGIVSKLGGAIEVDSEVERGARFTIYLPVAPGNEREPGPAEDHLLRGDARILVVDDEPELVLIICQMLESLGYQVAGAYSGPEALAIYNSAAERFDLLLTDQLMPQMTGLELAKRLRAAEPGLPVILISGFSEALTPELAATLQIHTCLSKPVLKAELATAIRDALAR